MQIVVKTERQLGCLLLALTSYLSYTMRREKSPGVVAMVHELHDLYEQTTAALKRVQEYKRNPRPCRCRDMGMIEYGQSPTCPFPHDLMPFQLINPRMAAIPKERNRHERNE